MKAKLIKNNLPQKWNQVNLGKVGSVLTGGTPRTGTPEYWGGSILWMSSGEVNQRRVYDTEKRITEAGLKSSNATLLPKGAVMVALAGQGKTRGKVAVLEVESTCNQSLAAIIPNTDELTSDFLFYSLERRYQELRNISGGEGRAGLNLRLIKEVKIQLPPLAEQKKIAEILRVVDDEITKIEEIISSTEKLKKGLMQKFFINSIKNKVGILGHYLIEKPSYGINAPAVNYSETLPTYIRITDISEQGRFISENKKSVDHKDYQNYLLREGDFLFARTGASVGKTYLYDPKDGPLVFAGFLIKVKTDQEKLLPKYLSYFTQTSRYWSWVRTTSMRSGQPGVNGNEYSRMPIPVPSIKEQEKVILILSSIDEKIFLNQKLKENLIHLKKGLMQDLLTGKVRTI